MSPENKLPSDELSRPEVLRGCAFFKDRLAYKIRQRSLRSANLLTGKLSSGYQDFTLEGWNYLVERTKTTEGSVTSVSITRFPLDTQNTDIVSEGLRFVITNPKLTKEESVIEYHIARKENRGVTSRNKRETLGFVQGFTETTPQYIKPPLSK